MKVNNWQLCSKNPPPQYTRVEIKTKQRKKYVGYRYKDKYYETFGNYIIKDPFRWRYIPQYSLLAEEIKSRIRRSNYVEAYYGS